MGAVKNKNGRGIATGRGICTCGSISCMCKHGVEKKKMLTTITTTETTTVNTIRELRTNVKTIDTNVTSNAHTGGKLHREKYNKSTLWFQIVIVVFTNCYFFMHHSLGFEERNIILGVKINFCRFETKILHVKNR